MPEIKHQFTGGKMNKDLDERLVPNGEYRDAMNIQVSTSEGSAVGTVQNILGNNPGCTYTTPTDNPITSGSKTIGSVADEKNDTLYWLVAGPDNFPSNIIPDNGDYTWDSVSLKDIIMRKTSSGCEPVFVDKYGFLTHNDDVTDGNTDSIALNDTSLYSNIVPGMYATGYNINGDITFNSTLVTGVGNITTIPLSYQSGSTNTPYYPFLMPNFAVLFLPTIPGSPDPWQQSDGNVVYFNESELNNSTYPANITDLIGDSLYIPSTGVTAQTFTIQNAEIITIQTTGATPTGWNVVKLTLDSNINCFVATGDGGCGDISDFGNIIEIDNGNSAISYEYNGSPMMWQITSDVQLTNSTPTNEINILPSSYGWLSEVHDLFYDENGVVQTGVKLRMAPSWMWATGGCIDPDSIDATYNPLLPDASFDIVDCDDYSVAWNPLGFSNHPITFEIDNGSVEAVYLNRLVNLGNGINGSGATYTLRFDSIERVLNFDQDKLITGINILDDMLLWTDGNTEPKKINISRSISGTDSGGDTHTRLIAQGIDKGPIREKNVTVIKKSPTNQLTLELITEREADKTYSGIVETNDNFNFAGVSPSDGSNYFEVEIAEQEHDFPADSGVFDTFTLEGWEVGKRVVLKEWGENDTEGPNVPLNNFRIKGRIADWDDNEFNATTGSPARAAIEVDMVDGVAPIPGDGLTLNYTIDLLDESEKLFEFKFPRFSYRYKYEDNEYSTYAPFTEVAFVPGGYKLDSKVGYNLGMTNLLKEVKIKNLITDDIPKDVVGIDILYKEDTSPNVYIVDTIKPNDENTLEEGTTNYWAMGEYPITSDTLHAVLPSNQLLRPWDNVPRKALAQEITGNRIVYGNYTQGYDLSGSGNNFIPQFKHSLVAYADAKNQTQSKVRSIKSLRSYQLGVVFVDKYGRETPILTNDSGVFKANKENAGSAHAISAGFKGSSSPSDMEYFKFFIKETSGEYYNMAMDRFYDAEDDGMWLAFLSSDRNKIDEETFLILKKGTNSDKVVQDQARYKILAIENEAPDFIKTTFNNIGEVKQVGGGATGDPYDNNLDNAPRTGVKEFQADYTAFESSSLKNIDTITDNLYVEFYIQGKDFTSERYELTSVTLHDDDVYFQTKKLFGDDVDHFNNGSSIKPNVMTRIIKGKVENKSQFDGKFFVKIYNDDVFVDNIKSSTTSEDTEYRTTAEKKIYLMASDHMERHNSSSRTSQNPKYGSGVYSGTAYGWVTGTTDDGNPWEWEVRGKDWTFYNDSDTTWKWSAFRSYFKSSKTVSEHADLSTNSRKDMQREFMKWTLNLADERSRHGEINRRKDENDPSFNGENHYQDVFFIDNGPFLSTGRSMTTNQQSNFNFNRTSGSGQGITNWGNSNDLVSEGRMDLGFGPLEPDKFYNWWKREPGENYWTSWGDGTLDSRNSYTRYNNIFKKTTSGHQFRWKEDPTKTIYTIFKSWEQKNRKRYAMPKIGGDKSVELHAHDAWDNGPYFDGSNNTPVSRFHFQPAMTAWNPTNGGGSSNEGIIDGSRVIDKYITHDLTTGDTTVTAITTVAADWEANYVVLSNSIFNNTIDTEYGESTPNQPLSSYEMQEIVPGMILKSIGGTTAAADYGILVKSVMRGDSDTTIVFEGYNSVSFADLSSKNGALIFKQPTMNGLSVNSAANIGLGSGGDFRGIGAVGYTIEFIEPIEREDLLPEDPAVWETEPKETADLDIYYEIGDYNPLRLNRDTIKTALPVDSRVYSKSQQGWRPDDINDVYIVNNQIGDNNGISGDIIILSKTGCVADNLSGDGCLMGTDTTDSGTIVVPKLEIGSVLRITRPNGLVFSVAISEIFFNTNTPHLSNKFRIDGGLHNGNYFLNWHNCYSFGNGVESNRIRDSFNLPFIANGVKASATIPEEYKEEHRKYGLIYSGLYNSNSGVNNLNQFIAAEKITKDINPSYGSIQKLHSRSTADGDLIALCEDRVLRILADKDAIYNADGNPQLIATNRVLGTATPYSGEYGISTNPESFASESYRVYFTDKVRGTVMRLSKDGLTPISDHGMKDWFRDNLKLSNKLVGSYDDKKDEYNITLENTTENIAKSVSFREDTKGWVSFKSFVPENGVSCANEYYTFKDGKTWKHHDETVDRNTFYKDAITTGFTASSINVILNESPGTIKTFHTLNYEGTQSKVNTFTDYNTYHPGTNVVDVNIYNNEYYNLGPDKPGWSVEHVQTDQEEGSLNEFIEKEGKWFNYIRGKAGSVTDGASITSGFNNADFSFQGIGVLSQNATSVNNSGCTDPLYVEYDSNAVIDDGSCVTLIVLGCMDPAADGGNNWVGNGNFPTVDDGSCIYYGCPDNYYPDGCGVGCNGALNFDGINYTDNGSCVYCVYGCMTVGQFNYDVLNTCVNVPDSCVPIILGCISDPSATNFAGVGNTNGVNPPANTDDGSCFTTVNGCTDLLACNYDPLANSDDGSCLYCGGTGTDVDNNDGGSCNDGCLYCTEVSNFNVDSFTDTTINLSWTAPSGSNIATWSNYNIVYADSTGASLSAYPSATDTTWSITGLLENMQYEIEMVTACSNSFSTETIITQTTATTQVYGCTDSQAWNYGGANINTEDGSCIYEGCTDPSSLNGITTFNHPNPSTFYTNPIDATIDDGSCVAIVNGCTDAAATNYDPLANVDDGSCTYPVPGCMDDSLNNSGGYAATNYDPLATIDDGSCTYIYPHLYAGPSATNGIMQGMQAPLLNTVGWTTTSVWGGTYRIVFAVWDVSSSPAIDKNNLQFAWENSHPLSTAGFASSSWFYSNDDGASWSSGTGFTNGDTIQLIRFRSSPSGVVEFLPSATQAAFYPPTANNGAQMQAAKIGFTNANIPTNPYTTNVETYNVLLGCNDPTALNYVNAIAFYDNNLCTY